MPATTELEFDLSTGERNVGLFDPVLITDLSALLEPPPSELPASYRHLPDLAELPYSPVRLAEVLDIGNCSTTDWSSSWHIATDRPWRDVKEEMKPMWRAYAWFCNNGAGMKLTVVYHARGGQACEAYYGPDTGVAHGVIHLYGREFWSAYSSSDDPMTADWSYLLRVRLTLHLDGPVSLAQFESRLTKGVRSGDPGQTRIAVVRPAESPPGYSLRAFRLLPE
jgi:hypothetical protein